MDQPRLRHAVRETAPSGPHARNTRHRHECASPFPTAFSIPLRLQPFGLSALFQPLPGGAKKPQVALDVRGPAPVPHVLVHGAGGVEVLEVGEAGPSRVRDDDVKPSVAVCNGGDKAVDVGALGDVGLDGGVGGWTWRRGGGGLVLVVVVVDGVALGENFGGLFGPGEIVYDYVVGGGEGEGARGAETGGGGGYEGDWAGRGRGRSGHNEVGERGEY